MGRPLHRFVADQVNELTIRTVDSRWSPVPKPRLKLEWIGILAEACSRSPAVLLHDFRILSSHATYRRSGPRVGKSRHACRERRQARRWTALDAALGEIREEKRDTPAQ